MTSKVTEELQIAFSRLPKTDTHPYQSVLFSELEMRHAAMSMSGAHILLALHRAREARELAVSYRDFKVGASLGFFALNEARAQFVTGINVKPDETTSLNMHAEQAALQKVRDRQGDFVAVVSVVGELQADTQSGQLAKTLHPCGLCRGVLKESGLVHDDHTLVVTALPDLRTVEMFPFGALESFHEHGIADDMYTVSLPEMDMLKPFQPESSGAVALIETPQMRVEEDIWNEKVEFPLLQYRLTGQWPS